MRRIVHPKCTHCKSRTAEYDSALFPKVMLCHSCMTLVSTFFYEMGERKWSILLEEFGHWSQKDPMTLFDGSTSQWLFIPSEHSPGAWTQVPVVIPFAIENLFSDSETNHDNPLDILD